jgi:preprotein translocase subunit SecD
VAVIPGKNQIRVTLPDESDLHVIENLLIQKGALAFYEVYSPEQYTEQFSDSKKLLSMLNPVSGGHSHVIIGCQPIADMDKVNTWMNSAGLNQKVKFAWGQSSESTEVCLYALKPADDQRAFPTGADIESIKYSQDPGSKDFSIGITFKKPAADVWYEATKRNMNHAIAIVLDNKVIYAPTVKSEISSGICSITGDFTEVQARSFAALVNNGELPVDFKLVK